MAAACPSLDFAKTFLATFVSKELTTAGRPAVLKALRPFDDEGEAAAERSSRAFRRGWRTRLEPVYEPKRWLSSSTVGKPSMES
ncbi:MAG: hypothetical protein ACP5VR_07140 [Acidimicrobiales bacterium]